MTKCVPNKIADSAVNLSNAVTINGGITDGRGGETVGRLWSWCRRRTVLTDTLNGDRRVGAGADEPLGETLPGDQPAKMTESNDLCREPSIIPDRLRLIQFSADEVGNLALVWSRSWCWGLSAI